MTASTPKGNERCPSRPELLLEQAQFDGRWVRGRALIRAGRRNVTVLPYMFGTFGVFVYGSHRCSDQKPLFFSNPALIGFCDRSAGDPCDPFVLRDRHFFGGEVQLLVAADDPEECVEFRLELLLPERSEKWGSPMVIVRAHRNGPVEVIEADSCLPPRAPEVFGDAPEGEIEDDS